MRSWRVLALPSNPSTQSSPARSTNPFRMKTSHLSISALCLALGVNLFAAETKTVDDFRAAAVKANAVLTIPDWQQTPEAVDSSVKDAIANANAALDQIAKQDPAKD